MHAAILQGAMMPNDTNHIIDELNGSYNFETAHIISDVYYGRGNSQKWYSSPHEAKRVATKLVLPPEDNFIV